MKATYMAVMSDGKERAFYENITRIKIVFNAVELYRESDRDDSPSVILALGQGGASRLLRKDS